MKKWVDVTLTIVVLLLGGVISFNFIKQRAVSDFLSNRLEPSHPVTIKAVSAVNWIPTITTIGFVESYQGVILTTETSGVVKSIHFQSGANVRKGQVLVLLDSKVEEASLKSREAHLISAREKYKRYKNLYSKKLVSQVELDEVEATYLSLDAEIVSLRAKLQHHSIVAPFMGVVGIRNIHLGQYLKPGSEVARIEDTSAMRLRASISQNDISSISPNQKVEIIVESYPGHVLLGSITAIEPSVNARSGLVEIEVDIPNAKGKLRSGMFAKAKILLPEEENQVFVPQTAVNYTLYGSSVYVVREDDGEKRVTQTIIETGEHTKDRVKVLKGLKTGDEVVTSGQIRLSNGAKVHVVQGNSLDLSTNVPTL